MKMWKASARLTNKSYYISPFHWITYFKSVIVIRYMKIL